MNLAGMAPNAMGEGHLVSRQRQQTSRMDDPNRDHWEQLATIHGTGADRYYDLDKADRWRHFDGCRGICSPRPFEPS